MAHTLSTHTRDAGTREEVDEYVRKHRVKEIMQVVFSEIVLHLPENPYLYMMASLRNKISLCNSEDNKGARPKRVTALRNGSKRGGVVCFVSDTKELFLEKLSSALNIKAKRLFSPRGAEFGEIEYIEDDETVYVSAGEEFMEPQLPSVTAFESQVSVQDLPQPPREPTPEPIFTEARIDLDESERAKLKAASTRALIGTVEASLFLEVLNQSRIRGHKAITLDNFNQLLESIASATNTEFDRAYTTTTFSPALFRLFEAEAAGSVGRPASAHSAGRLGSTGRLQSMTSVHGSQTGSSTSPSMSWVQFAGAAAVLLKGSADDKLKCLFSIAEHDGILSGLVEREVLKQSIESMLRVTFEFGELEWSADVVKTVRDFTERLFPAPEDPLADPRLDFTTFCNFISTSPSETLRQLLKSDGPQHIEPLAIPIPSSPGAMSSRPSTARGEDDYYD